MTDPRGIAAALIQSQRVEMHLAVLGWDRLAIYGVQQEIADLYQSTTLSWEEATDRIMDPIRRGERR